MPTRRNFIKSSALLASSVLISPKNLIEIYKKKEIGLQLYTVRELMNKDPKGTLAQIAKIGYTTLEGTGYSSEGLFYGFDPKMFAKILKDLGLSMPSSHFHLGEDKIEGKEDVGTILHGWEKVVDDSAGLGLKFMVCGYLTPTERGNLEHYKFLADQFNKAGEICKKSGIQFCYHNHNFEFEKQEGQFPYDLLLKNTDPALVKFEMDMYWMKKAEQDPLAYFKEHSHRFPLWHVKDMDNTEKKEFTEVGNGIIDFKKIFAASKSSGLQYYFVEQDECPGTPLESISKSIEYIKANLI
jgi:sugar phosphate isomerase/epimerase